MCIRDSKKAFATRDKQDRSNQISEITDKAKKLYEEDENYTDLDVNSQLKNLEKSIVTTDILKNKNRIRELKSRFSCSRYKRCCTYG